jgi:hypothetical protein
LSVLYQNWGFKPGALGATFRDADQRSP